MTRDSAGSICLKCGLCCNGVIFARGQLRPGDDAALLERIGLELAPQRRGGGDRKFLQPCRALDGCRCRIYGQRPEYCRAFECLLLKGVLAGRVTTAAALRRIREARAAAAEVDRLLRVLGDEESSLALSLRFNRLRRRLERSRPGRESAAAFGDLTVAVHELNMILAESFYCEG
ncbi:MAG: YkgJ family cysteine cluster protein [Verrucomicrobiota bacterium]